MELNILFWHWLIACVIFMIAEALLPGSFLLWVGCASGFVGLISFTFDLTLQYQMLTFAILCPIMAFLGRLFYKKQLEMTDHSTLNQGTISIVGRFAPLSGELKQNKGHLILDEKMWAVKGPNLPAGTLVRVVAVEENILHVEEVKN